jgi:hypothetical protein
MAADGLADRIALGSLDDGLTFAELARCRRRARTLRAPVADDRVVFVDENTPVPTEQFGAAVAVKPLVPVNYRLADDRFLPDGRMYSSHPRGAAA